MNALLLEIYLHLTETCDLMQLFFNVLNRYIKFDLKMHCFILPYPLNPVFCLIPVLLLNCFFPCYASHTLYGHVQPPDRTESNQRKFCCPLLAN
jgi:hypothetical protein